MTAKTSPAGPTIIGSTTLSTAALATAASTALPPCMRMRSPACAPSGWLVTTMPCRAITSERVCASHPSERSPRSPLQNAGFAAALHVAAAASHCAPAVTGARTAAQKSSALGSESWVVMGSLRPGLSEGGTLRRAVNRGKGPGEVNGPDGNPQPFGKLLVNVLIAGA